MVRELDEAIPAGMGEGVWFRRGRAGAADGVVLYRAGG